MPASLDPQLAMDERAVNDPDLESALERRLRAKDDVSEVRVAYKVAHKEVNALLDKVADFPADSALRVGRFRITKRQVEAKHVEFDAEAREQISIGLVDEDGKPARRGRVSRTAKPKPASEDDFDDLRPKGEVNTDALRAEADRATLPDEPTKLRPGGRHASRNAQRGPHAPIQ